MSQLDRIIDIVSLYILAVGPLVIASILAALFN